MALNANAMTALLRTRENARRQLAAAQAELTAAHAEIDRAQQVIERVNAALAPFGVIYDATIPPTATLDEIIARLGTR